MCTWWIRDRKRGWEVVTMVQPREAERLKEDSVWRGQSSEDYLKSEEGTPEDSLWGREEGTDLKAVRI